MGKKYELIRDDLGRYRIIALKDFTLITGEQVKKGDIGGYVLSEDCLTQEGNCWVMDCAYIKGTVSGNAVIKNYSKVYGTVSGNAVVKDQGFVGPNATATGNAVVQAYQCINHGVVTTDLLGTKDWASALYAELGIVPKNGKIILHKTVRGTDNLKIFKSWYKNSFLYEVEKEAVETDVDEDTMKTFGKGLHFTSLEFVDEDVRNTILECEVDLEDIITVQHGIIRARKCKVIRVYKEE